MNKVKSAKKIIDIGFRVDTPQLLKEFCNNQGMAIMKIPINELQRWLHILAERATELNDPELNIIMLSMNLYDVPYWELVKQIENQIELRDNYISDVQKIKNQIEKIPTGRVSTSRFKDEILKIINQHHV